MIYTVTQINITDLTKSTVSLFLFQVTFTGPLEGQDAVKVQDAAAAAL